MTDSPWARAAVREEHRAERPAPAAVVGPQADVMLRRGGLPPWHCNRQERVSRTVQSSIDRVFPMSTTPRFEPTISLRHALQSVCSRCVLNVYGRCGRTEEPACVRAAADEQRVARTGHDLRVAVWAPNRAAKARKVLDWPKRYKWAHAFLWEYSYKRLQLAQLLGQLGVVLT